MAARGLADGLDAGVAQFELEPPAVLADFGIGPEFERADLREVGAELYGHETLLGRLAEADDGVERRVLVEVRARWRSTLAGCVVGAGERAVEAEADGAVGDELEAFAAGSTVDRAAFFGAAGDQGRRRRVWSRPM